MWDEKLDVTIEDASETRVVGQGQPAPSTKGTAATEKTDKPKGGK